MPDNSTFNLTMTRLIKGFNLDETCQILDSYIERGLKPGFNTYLALMQALYSIGKYAEGDRYFDQMTKGGLSRFLTLQCNGTSGGLPVHLCHTICSRCCTYYLARYAGSVARKIKK
ncbi:hypothetical protein ES319_D03G079300v1 [Gossypium barbadense]|uniref:Pentacotripeptide-repeat region of PRORP domain-containing protein n=2 Tax=Gossypium TaxID=3633 RepID=A0A5J5S213_GOSBA|nr:hypothetical protein ES319_D03G079300v1 [Gossypium barbadense]TYG76097.1 hypothetical protein ES288_D03G085800v1 [Gossypium darwinii]